MCNFFLKYQFSENRRGKRHVKYEPKSLLRFPEVGAFIRTADISCHRMIKLTLPSSMLLNNDLNNYHGIVTDCYTKKDIQFTRLHKN